MQTSNKVMQIKRKKDNGMITSNEELPLEFVAAGVGVAVAMLSKENVLLYTMIEDKQTLSPNIIYNISTNSREQIAISLI